MGIRDELLTEITEEKEDKKEKARQNTLRYNRELYAKTGRKRNQPRDIRSTQSRKLRNRYKDQLIKRLGGKCHDCKQSFPQHRNVYDFHHIDSTTKEGMVNFNQSWNKIVVEGDKCVLLCANCHRKVHTHDTQTP